MKKLLALLLVAIMVLTLVACGGDDNAKSKDEDSKQEEVKKPSNVTKPSVSKPAKDEDSIVGCWVNEDEGIGYEFTKKGEVIMTLLSFDESVTGEYEYADGVLTIDMEGEEADIDAELDGDDLVLTAGDETLELVKVDSLDDYIYVGEDYDDIFDDEDYYDEPDADASSSIEEYVEENKDIILGSMEESFTESSGMTCTSDIEVAGNGFIIYININELDDIDDDTKELMQEAYDGMESVWDLMLESMQSEVAELEYIEICVCEGDGDIIATIRAD